MTAEERYARELLARAARLLEASFRPHQTAVSGPEGKRFKARLAWPGVVIVTRCDDGGEVIRSKPGQPFEVDDTARADHRGTS